MIAPQFRQQLMPEGLQETFVTRPLLMNVAVFVSTPEGIRVSFKALPDDKMRIKDNLFS